MEKELTPEDFERDFENIDLLRERAFISVYDSAQRGRVYLNSYAFKIVGTKCVDFSLNPKGGQIAISKGPRETLKTPSSGAIANGDSFSALATGRYFYEKEVKYNDRTWYVFKLEAENEQKIS